MKKNRISEEKEEIILIRYNIYKTVSLQRVINTTSNGKVTNGRTPEEMDDIIRHYISGAVSGFFFLYENTKLILDSANIYS